MARIIVVIGCFALLLVPTFAPAQTTPDTSQALVPLNINKHLYYITNTLSAGHMSSPYTGSTFPARTFHLAYVDELLWGGHVTDRGSKELRIGGGSYISGMQPGVIAEGSTPADYEPGRVYRIRRDHATADLREDAADYFDKEPSVITDDDIALLRRQYAHDWQAWPVEVGAPFYDGNGNGLRDPGEDPGLLDADMVCWSACNDLDSTRTRALYGSAPTGMEIQSTWWAYKEAGHALANTIFVRYRILFKGTPALAPDVHIDSLYITKFVDPDLGSSGDDLFGLDTVLQAAYMYNGSEHDIGNPSIVPPAVGWQMLQGPIVASDGSTGIFDLTRRPGCRNLRISSFFPKWTGVPWSDPPFGPRGLTRAFRWMRGYIPDEDNVPLRLLWDENGHPTFFKLTGDPVMKTGDIDGLGGQWSGAPGERRFLLSTGPLTMARGDTQEVVYAIVGADGNDRLRNVEYFRWQAKYVQEAWPDPASLRVYAIPEPAPREPLPERVTLWSNYPNPFNPATSIRFDLPSPRSVRLAVYDMLGREVRVLVNEVRGEGTHVVTWNGTNAAGEPVSSGVYVYQFRSDALSAAKRMVLIR